MLRRDRRRVRRLALATVLLWFFAVAGIPVFFTLFATFILPKANWIVHEMITHERGTPAPRLYFASGRLAISLLIVCAAIVYFIVR